MDSQEKVRSKKGSHQMVRVMTRKVIRAMEKRMERRELQLEPRRP
jgi:hypothetical protein